MAPTLFTDSFRYLRAACAATSLIALAGCPAVAQTTSDIEEWRPRTALKDPEQVAARVARSVVQVVATDYGAPPNAGILRLERLVAAGAIVGEDGYILTSAQVVSQARRIDVVLPGTPSVDGASADTSVPAEVVGLVPDLDLALLRIPVDGLPTLRFATGTPMTGDTTVTVAPAGPGTHAIAVGVVLAAGAPVCTGSPVPYLVTDAAPGAAGAAIVNLDGELLGLAAAFAGDSADAPRATAALPAPLLAFALTQMRDGTTFRRGVVGLSADTLVRPWSDGATLSGRLQLLVSAVAPGLPAERAGLRAGDAIVAIDGRAVEGMPLTSLFLALYTLRDGQTLTLDVRRDGAAFTFRPTATAVTDVVASH